MLTHSIKQTMTFKPLIITPCYKRYELTAKWARWARWAADYTGGEALGVGDEENEAAFIERGLSYIKHPNKPLGAKINFAIADSLPLIDTVTTDFTHVILTGSDDFCNSRLLDVYKSMAGYDFVALLDGYFYEPKSERCIYWRGYKGRRRGEPVGMFKMLSVDLLKKLDFAPFDPELNQALDLSMHRKLKGLSYKRQLLRLNRVGAIAVDVKTGENITAFRKWNNSNFIQGKEIKRFIKSWL